MGTLKDEDLRDEQLLRRITIRRIRSSIVNTRERTLFTIEGGFVMWLKERLDRLKWDDAVPMGVIAVFILALMVLYPYGKSFFLSDRVIKCYYAEAGTSTVNKEEVPLYRIRGYKPFASDLLVYHTLDQKDFFKAYENTFLPHCTNK